MAKLFNKKNSPVDLSDSHLVTNEIKWEDFFVDDIERKLKVIKQAKSDGSNNIPSSNTNNLSNCETKIISQANNYISRIQKTATKFFSELKEQLIKLVTLLRTNQLSHFAVNLSLELEKIISSAKNKLEQYRKTLKEHLETLTQFKKNNELSEEARCPTKDEALYSLIFIIFLFILELIVNSGILADGEHGGRFAGLIIALGFSIINVIFSSLIGYFILKQINSVIKFNRVAATAAIIVFIVTIIILNLLLGAYRSSVELSKFNGAVDWDKLKELRSNIFEIHFNTIGFLLFALGVLASITAIYKGYIYNDVYPGYGPRQSKVNQEREKIKKIILNLSEEILESINNTVNNIQNYKGQLINRLNEWNQNTIKIQYEFNNYEKKLEILEKNIQQLLLLYRNNNKSVRNLEQPSYFDKNNYTVDPKDKSLPIVFSNIYEHYYDDKKRDAKYEELLTKIENFFNNCLKEIEKVKENFLLKKVKINDEYKAH